MSLAASNTYFSTCPLFNWLTPESNELIGTANTRMSSQSTISVTRTSGTVLSVGASSSASAPQYVRFNPKSRVVTSALTLTLTAGTGTGVVEVWAELTASGTIIFRVVSNDGNTYTLTGTGSLISTAAGFQPAPNGVLIWAWSTTSGAFDTTSVGTVYPSGPAGDQQLSTDSWVDSIEAANTTAGAVTLLAQDGLGTPIQLFPTASLAANSTMSYVHP
jgi:hypothetical protein